MLDDGILRLTSNAVSCGVSPTHNEDSRRETRACNVSEKYYMSQLSLSTLLYADERPVSKPFEICYSPTF
jgi:hypothetical protein